MKIYKVKSGIVVEQGDKFYLLKDEEWDSFINDDDLLKTIGNKINASNQIDNAARAKAS